MDASSGLVEHDSLGHLSTSCPLCSARSGKAGELSLRLPNAPSLHCTLVSGCLCHLRRSQLSGKGVQLNGRKEWSEESLER